jgi:S1-C subfamily serine protease
MFGGMMGRRWAWNGVAVEDRNRKLGGWLSDDAGQWYAGRRKSSAPSNHARRRRSIHPAHWLSLLVIIVTAAYLIGRRPAADGPPPNLGNPVKSAGIGEPRKVEPRGALTEEESANIHLFERCSKSVVYVSPIVNRVRRTLFGPPQREIKEGTGSGFVWDDSGHIVTNYHVVRGANACNVTLPDNSTYPADLVGIWPVKDTAVLRIDAPKEKLVPIAIGTSNDLRVGQKVYAIGNPFGLDFTFTVGVVSALNREIDSFEDRTIQGVIQTDADINPGNSGGPLLDTAGRLIGMNTQILSSSGQNAGIGFAIPVDTINSVVPQLIEHGHVTRPGLGIHPADDVLSRRVGDEGVLVLTVTEGSAADQAGLRPTQLTQSGYVPGDMITHVGDQAIPNRATLFNVLELYQVGDTVDVTVLRNGRKVVLPVTLQRIE